MCDRILVFSSNPGRVIAEIKVDLPQPRNRLDPGLPRPGRRHLRPHDGAGRARARRHVPRHGHRHGPAAHLDQHAGRADRGAGRGAVRRPADLPELAERTQLEVDELLPSPKPCSCCASPSWRGRSAAERGRPALCQGGDRRAQALFAQHLLSYVPLAAHIKHILEERPSHRASIIRFQDELEDTMPEEDAEMTLHTVINWPPTPRSWRSTAKAA